MPKPAQFSTKDRILSAAEELFAVHGFAGTSLRQVTSVADVNIAAVNYHFGSKENLVNEVFRRRMDEMSAARLAQLARANAEYPGQLRAVLAAFVEPALAIAGPFGAVLNATPLGMKVSDPLPLDVDRLAPGTWVGEVVMTQEYTPLLRAAQARQCHIQRGTDMLFEMIPAYLRFFDLPVATPEQLRALAEIRY